jgi:hypothetical protein
MAIREHGIFRLLERPAPDAALGGCYIYHSSGPCVDTGVLIDFEGTLTLSLVAIKELAEVAGMSVNEEGLQLEYENAWQAGRILQLEAERDTLLDQLSAIGTAVRIASEA